MQISIRWNENLKKYGLRHKIFSRNDEKTFDGLKDALDSIKDTCIELYLGENSISAESANIEHLKNFLKDSKTITKLNLYDNQIGPEGAIAISEALKDNKVITTLNLRNNQIGDEGAKAIAGFLKDNKAITVVSLSDNQIGDEGAKSIAKALKDKAITILYLGHNQIGDEGAKEIAEALKDNKTITGLFLSDNKIGDEGSNAISAALKDNKTITGLFLDNNKISHEGKKALAEVLKDNKDIQIFGLKINQVIDNQKAKLTSADIREINQLWANSIIEIAKTAKDKKVANAFENAINKALKSSNLDENKKNDIYKAYNACKDSLKNLDIKELTNIEKNAKYFLAGGFITAATILILILSEIQPRLEIFDKSSLTNTILKSLKSLTEKLGSAISMNKNLFSLAFIGLFAASSMALFSVSYSGFKGKENKKSAYKPAKDIFDKSLGIDSPKLQSLR